MMGAILSKTMLRKQNDDAEIESTTPIVSAAPNNLVDPRSPNLCRTPINDLPFTCSKIVSKAQDLTNDDNISTSLTTTPTKLKTKLLRDLGYSFDPRSPTVDFDRTPLNFKDPDLTDDLSSLSLYESDINTPIKETITNNSLSETSSTPRVKNVESSGAVIDPRSPSIDIERTPLNLNIIMENEEEFSYSESNIIEEKVESLIIEETDPTVITAKVINSIYLDENQSQPTTPNRKYNKIEKPETQRTPLSCLINTDHRNAGREKVSNRKTLARSIFNDAMPSAHQNSAKMNNSSSKIPVFRRSISK
jgi:hypothetical protein